MKCGVNWYWKWNTIDFRWSFNNAIFMSLCHCVKSIIPSPHENLYARRRGASIFLRRLLSFRWLRLRVFEFSKLGEHEAIRSLVPLGVFKLPKIAVDGGIPVVWGPKFRTLRLHLTSRSIRVYSIRTSSEGRGEKEEGKPPYLEIDWNQSTSPRRASIREPELLGKLRALQTRYIE